MSAVAGRRFDRAPVRMSSPKAGGARGAGRFRLVRYELRCWCDGVIPDVAEAVESPRRAHRLLALVPEVPTAVWGRDELGAGEMWTSNSVVSWLIARSGLDVESIRPRWAAALRVGERASWIARRQPPTRASRGLGRGRADLRGP